jgi:hypothetical protein
MAYSRVWLCFWRFFEEVYGEMLIFECGFVDERVGGMRR